MASIPPPKNEAHLPVLWQIVENNTKVGEMGARRCDWRCCGTACTGRTTDIQRMIMPRLPVNPRACPIAEASDMLRVC